MATTVLKIGSTDFTAYLIQGGFSQTENVMVNEARDLLGNANFDIINRKIKLICKFRPMNKTEMAAFRTAIDPYIVSISYLDNKTDTLRTITCYTGENTQEYYMLKASDIIFNGFQCNFIEM
jgi:hypothetical protein